MKSIKSFTKFLMIVMSVLLVLAGCSSKESSTSKKDGTSSNKPYEITMAYLTLNTKIDELPLVGSRRN
ncbi:hypothetical protein V7139_25140 [Neobacillus drentensis]|uniref:hypothetical protein n=1 Tax=Neobacillus drentensis TaxID=220684 RepID=UPI0030034A10